MRNMKIVVTRDASSGLVDARNQDQYAIVAMISAQLLSTDGTQARY